MENKDLQKVSVFRKSHFNAAHKLAVPEWSDAKNFDIFGPCSYANFHGHNYELTVKVIGIPDEITGFVIDLKILKMYIQEEIIDRFDHRNLNLDTEFFKTQLPTVENIAKVIYQLLRKRIDRQQQLQVRLYETPKNFAEFPVNPI